MDIVIIGDPGFNLEGLWSGDYIKLQYKISSELRLDLSFFLSCHFFLLLKNIKLNQEIKVE